MINDPFDNIYSSEINSDEFPNLELPRNFDSCPDFYHENSEYFHINNISEETSKDFEMNINQNIETVLEEEKDEDYKEITEPESREKKIKFITSTTSNENINAFEENKEFRYDNEVQKIKSHFLKSLWRFLNNKHHKIMNINSNRIYSEFLKKIKYKCYSSTKKEDNLLFLNLKIKDLFSILENKTIEEMLNSYANGDYKEEGFYLENDLALIEEKSKNKKGVILEKYIETLRETVKNFRKIFEEKSGRNKFSKKYK